MLEQVTFSEKKLTKKEYKSVYDELIASLISLQQQAREQEVGLVVLVEGWKGAGKGSRISDLVYNLDARATHVAVTPDIDPKETSLFEPLGQGVTGYYPFMQEFWKALGPRGHVTFFDRGWYFKALQDMLLSLFGEDFGKKKKKVGKKKLKEMQRSLQAHKASIEDFERQLVDNGYAVLKLFLHISEQEQKKRLLDLRSDPSTQWRVSKEDVRRADNYHHAFKLYDEFIGRSDFSFAPWTIIDAEDKRQANLDIAAALEQTFDFALKRKNTPEQRLLIEHENMYRQRQPEASKPLDSSGAPSNFIRVLDPPSLDRVDRTLVLSRDYYRKKLKFEQRRFHELELEMYHKRIPLMVMFEGWDAAGKGGAIKRMAQALDARSYEIFPSPVPTAYEKLHPHLWRYWMRLPKAGHVGIYDRSWYGRVLVERVEGFASVPEWERAYDEINAFERDLSSWGAILVKFWVEVSQDEQLNRFKEREIDPRKRWKITEEDWRNREKYPLYKAAVEDMFKLTSTEQNPWTILESEDKCYARVKALQIVNDTLEGRLR